MDLKLPQELLKYLDEVRGSKSRQAYLVNMLAKEAEARKG